MFKANNETETVVKQKIEEHLEEMRQTTNTQLASYAKITKFIEQIEPFVKTPQKN